MIADARVADAQWIADIWNTVIADTLVTFTTTPKTVPEVADLIASRPVLVLPGRDGFATYGPFRAGPGYARTVEHTIHLAPQARGTGQGGTLLAALTDHARRAGHHVMVAGISGANPGAVRFHARHGFVQVGHLPQVGHKAGQWLDLILMQKQLTAPDTPRRSV